MIFLTAEGGILGPIAKIFGYLMNIIYLGLEKIGIGNIGLAIIIFTLITRLILYPFTVQQQKSSKLMPDLVYLHILPVLLLFLVE